MSDGVVIVAAGRSAIGSFGGSLAGISAADLGAKVIAGVLERAGLQPEQVDEVIMGQVLTSGCGQNPARQAALKANIPFHSPATTINMVCGSGLKAVHLAMQSVLCNDARIVVAGGQENMSLSPHLLPKSRNGQKMGDWSLIDSLVYDGLWDAFNNYHMGVTAENIARRFEISREEQDRFAAQSQQRAGWALEENRFRDEIVPIAIPQRKGPPQVFDKDEFPRPGTTEQALQGLRPVFDQGGSVTAGNASGINDGAAAVVVMRESTAQELGLKPLARIVAFASAGVDPQLMGMGPIPASTECLRKAGWHVEDLDRVEANEAFAAQALCVNQAMGWDPERVNVNGGAIALGHPIGASGARILVTLLYDMRRTGASRGLATLCIGGGMGVAMAVETIST
jgi:acetyl-CoA C-acetyltransferase